MTLAKGLGGGVPIGAVAMTEKAAAGLAQLAGGAVPHATTFGGNPLACAAAVAVLEIIENEGLLDRVTQAGEYLGEQARRSSSRSSPVTSPARAAAGCCAASPSPVRRRRSRRRLPREGHAAVGRRRERRPVRAAVHRRAPPARRGRLDPRAASSPRAQASRDGRGFLTLGDVAAEQWPALFDRAAYLKANRTQKTLAGKSVALVFEKASTRTRVSFEVGVFELGGHAVVLSSQGSQIARGEPIEDTARVLSGYCHGDRAAHVRSGAGRAAREGRSVPVVNGLSDQHHPCQVATDLFTVREKFGRIDGLRYAWIGDGNNMASSWIEAAGLFGLELALACPEGFAPDPLLVTAARDRQARLGRGSVTLTTDPKAAAERRARDLHRRLGIDGAGGGGRRAREGVPGLLRRHRARHPRGCRRDRAPLPAGTSRRGDHGRCPRWPPFTRVGAGGEPLARRQGHPRARMLS